MKTKGKPLSPNMALAFHVNIHTTYTAVDGAALNRILLIYFHERFSFT